MEKLEIILYGVATYLGLKSLVSLMVGHKQAYERKVAVELAAELSAKKSSEMSPPVASAVAGKPAVVKKASPVKKPA
jgi:hypothetical protein